LLRVSIIVPAYNSGRFLAATLDSVLSQTLKDWELIIVNDGSTDRTGTIAETYSRLDDRIRVVHQANAGISQARNRGFAAAGAECEYCLFLDSDDLLEPDALEILILALEEDPNAVGAHGMFRYIDSQGRPVAVGRTYINPRWRRGIDCGWLKVWSDSAPTTFAVLAYAPIIMTSGLLMRRAAKVVAGDFDPSLKVAQDWHMWLRLSRLGHLSFLNRVIFSYRRHEGNNTLQRTLKHESMLDVRKKMYALTDLNKVEKRIILIGLRYYRFYLTKLSLSYALNKLLKGRFIDAFKELLNAMKQISLSVNPAKSIIG
jgi:glycosyltransferase involved in cell wall biosynthesis